MSMGRTSSALSRQIKDYALDIGYSDAGITTANGFHEFMAAVKERGDELDWWTNSPRKPLDWAQPQRMTPSAKSIIVLIYDYGQRSFPPELLSMIGRAYLSRCYFAPPENINGARLKLMQDFLDARGVESQNALWLPQRWAAARAGVATFGKNCFAYSKGGSSFVIITTLVVDAELDYDEPTLETQCPSGCTCCVDACPTNALYAPYHMNARRCVSFCNWMVGYPLGDAPPGIVPHGLRPLLGQRIHGCDCCQEACPRNHKTLNAKHPRDAFLDAIAPDITLANLLHLPGGFYEDRVKPIMYNYIREPRFFQRNAAIAMGNTRDERYVDDLRAASGNEHPVVRAHVAWALGQIGGLAARQALNEWLSVETENDVREEIHLALEQCLNTV
jgi:epoxyqueuosine reductase